MPSQNLLLLLPPLRLHRLQLLLLLLLLLLSGCPCLASHSLMACSCLRQVATSSLSGTALGVPPKPGRHCSSPLLKTQWQQTNELLRPALTLTSSRQKSLMKALKKLTVVAQAVTTTSETETEAEAESETETSAEVTALEALQEPELPPTPRRKKTRGLQHIMEVLNKNAVEAASEGKQLPDLRPGDIIQLRVEVPENKKRVSLLRGIVIAKHNAGINTTFRIRRVLAGVGVEMCFPLYSPNIKEIKVVNKRKVRRAKLFYLRHKIARLSTV